MGLPPSRRALGLRGGCQGARVVDAADPADSATALTQGRLGDAALLEADWLTPAQARALATFRWPITEVSELRRLLGGAAR